MNQVIGSGKAAKDHTELMHVVYLKDHIQICQDLNRSTRNILSLILTYMDHDNIFSYSQVKDMFLQRAKDVLKTEYAISTIHNSFSLLCKMNIMYRIFRGSFIIDPRYFRTLSNYQDTSDISGAIEFLIDQREQDQKRKEFMRKLDSGEIDKVSGW